MDKEYQFPKHLSALCSMIAVGGWGIVCLYTDFIKRILEKKQINYELFWFVSSFILLVITFCILYNVFMRIKLKNFGESYFRENVLEICTLIMIGLVFIAVFLNEPYMADASSFSMPWHASKGVELLILLLGCLLFLQFHKISVNNVVRTNNNNLLKLPTPIRCVEP